MVNGFIKIWKRPRRLKTGRKSVTSPQEKGVKQEEIWRVDYNKLENLLKAKQIKF